MQTNTRLRGQLRDLEDAEDACSIACASAYHPKQKQARGTVSKSMVRAFFASLLMLVLLTASNFFLKDSTGVPIIGSAATIPTDQLRLSPKQLLLQVIVPDDEQASALSLGFASTPELHEEHRQLDATTELQEFNK